MLASKIKSVDDFIDHIEKLVDADSRTIMTREGYEVMFEFYMQRSRDDEDYNVIDVEAICAKWFEWSTMKHAAIHYELSGDDSNTIIMARLLARNVFTVPLSNGNVLTFGWYEG